MAATSETARMTETFFSSQKFADAWSRAMGFGQSGRPLAIPVRGSGPPRTMYGIERRSAHGLRSIHLGPEGFYGSPGWEGELSQNTVKSILRYLISPRTGWIVWNVRFDHEPLAAALKSMGLSPQLSTTQVLDLARGYDALFVGYNATIRNQVRKARRRGVVVRTSALPS